jgi:hypothetical protein
MDPKLQEIIKSASGGIDALSLFFQSKDFIGYFSPSFVFSFF